MNGKTVAMARAAVSAPEIAAAGRAPERTAGAYGVNGDTACGPYAWLLPWQR